MFSFALGLRELSFVLFSCCRLAVKGQAFAQYVEVNRTVCQDGADHKRSWLYRRRVPVIVRVPLVPHVGSLPACRCCVLYMYSYILPLPCRFSLGVLRVATAGGWVGDALHKSGRGLSRRFEWRMLAITWKVSEINSCCRPRLGQGSTGGKAREAPHGEPLCSRRTGSARSAAIVFTTVSGLPLCV